MAASAPAILGNGKQEGEEKKGVSSPFNRDLPRGWHTTFPLQLSQKGRLHDGILQFGSSVSPWFLASVAPKSWNVGEKRHVPDVSDSDSF